VGHQLLERMLIHRTLAADTERSCSHTLRAAELAIAALALAEVGGLEDAVSKDSAADSSETEDPPSAELERP
jgi:hypothetical protein